MCVSHLAHCQRCYVRRLCFIAMNRTAFAIPSFLPALRGRATSLTSRRPLATMSTISELPALKTIDGTTIDPARLSNKVVFAMNVASACGYTASGYKLLADLTEKFSPDNFAAVAIPCNAFGMQENGSPDEIATFALAKADKLVITERSAVNGPNEHPLVSLAKTKFPAKIGWNFDGRFVFDKDGTPVARFSNSSSDADIIAEIEKHV